MPRSPTSSASARSRWRSTRWTGSASTARAFEAIVAAYRALAERLDAGPFTAIPVSALEGDNVVSASPRLPWYAGPTLLAWLESAPSEIDALRAAETPFRFPVQIALRGYDAEGGGARGYAGRVVSGSVRVGAEVQVQPGGADGAHRRDRNP